MQRKGVGDGDGGGRGAAGGGASLSHGILQRQQAFADEMQETLAVHAQRFLLLAQVGELLGAAVIPRGDLAEPLPELGRDLLRAEGAVEILPREGLSALVILGECGGGRGEGSGEAEDAGEQVGFHEDALV